MLINHKWKTMNHKKVMLQSIAGPYSLEMVLEFKYSDYTLFFYYNQIHHLKSPVNHIDIADEFYNI